VGSYAHQSRRATIHDELLSWPVWGTCRGRSETRRAVLLACSLAYRHGEQAAKPTPRRRPLLLALEIRGIRMVKSKKMTVSQKYRSLKAQTERAGMTVKEKSGKLVVSRKQKGKKNG
jgi:hypothetical protein